MVGILKRFIPMQVGVPLQQPFGHINLIADETEFRPLVMLISVI